jgi:hypothetical protein
MNQVLIQDPRGLIGAIRVPAVTRDTVLLAQCVRERQVLTAAAAETRIKLSAVNKRYSTKP